MKLSEKMQMQDHVLYPTHVSIVKEWASEVAKLEEKLNTAQSNYQWMVDRAADQKLDGYRELGARAAEAENQRDKAEQWAAALARENVGLKAERDQWKELAGNPRLPVAEKKIRALEIEMMDLKRQLWEVRINQRPSRIEPAPLSAEEIALLDEIGNE